MLSCERRERAVCAQLAEPCEARKPLREIAVSGVAVIDSEPQAARVRARSSAPAIWRNFIDARPVGRSGSV
jgi:hypothetical protein